MGAVDIDKKLTMLELCEAVNALREMHPVVAATTEVAPRTVRYYIEKGLLEPVRSGPGKKYPAEAVWRVLFIRLLQETHNLELADIASFLPKIPAATMQRIVEGDEPLEVARQFSPAQIRRHRDRGFDVLALGQRGNASGAGANESDWQNVLESKAVRVAVSKRLRGVKRRQVMQAVGLIRSIVEQG